MPVGIWVSQHAKVDWGKWVKVENHEQVITHYQNFIKTKGFDFDDFSQVKGSPKTPPVQLDKKKPRCSYNNCTWMFGGSDCQAERESQQNQRHQLSRSYAWYVLYCGSTAWFMAINLGSVNIAPVLTQTHSWQSCYEYVKNYNSRHEWELNVTLQKTIQSLCKFSGFKVGKYFGGDQLSLYRGAHNSVVSPCCRFWHVARGLITSLM